MRKRYRLQLLDWGSTSQFYKKNSVKVNLRLTFSATSPTPKLSFSFCKKITLKPSFLNTYVHGQNYGSEKLVAQKIYDAEELKASAAKHQQAQTNGAHNGSQSPRLKRTSRTPSNPQHQVGYLLALQAKLARKTRGHRRNLGCQQKHQAEQTTARKNNKLTTRTNTGMTQPRPKQLHSAGFNPNISTSAYTRTYNPTVLGPTGPHIPVFLGNTHKTSTFTTTDHSKNKHGLAPAAKLQSQFRPDQKHGTLSEKGKAITNRADTMACSKVPTTLAALATTLPLLCPATSQSIKESGHATSASWDSQNSLLSIAFSPA